MASTRIRNPTLLFLTVLSWIPALYIPLAVIGLGIAAIGCLIQSEYTTKIGLQLTTPAIVLLLFVAALLAFSGVLNVVIYIVRWLACSLRSRGT